MPKRWRGQCLNVVRGDEITAPNGSKSSRCEHQGDGGAWRRSQCQMPVGAPCPSNIYYILLNANGHRNIVYSGPQRSQVLSLKYWLNISGLQVAGPEAGLVAHED